jgi:hypothetical protein
VLTDSWVAQRGARRTGAEVLSVAGFYAPLCGAHERRGDEMPKTKPKATVTVQCVACKDRREIAAGEVGRGDVPMCQKCFMPMVSVRAAATLVSGPP